MVKCKVNLQGKRCLFVVFAGFRWFTVYCNFVTLGNGSVLRQSKNVKVSVTDIERKAYLSNFRKTLLEIESYFVWPPSLKRSVPSFVFLKYVIYTDGLMDEKYRKQLSSSPDPEQFGNFNNTMPLIYLSSITIGFCRWRKRTDIN